MNENRCILFDLDGTLYDSPDYSRRLEEEISKFVSEEISTSYEAARVLLKERRDRLGTLTRALESLGIDRAKFFESMAARSEPSQYLSEDSTLFATITKLRHEFRIGLLSNSGRPLVEKVLRALQLDESTFDAIVTSSDVRPKPSSQPFLLALDLLNCNRQSAIYVGDRDEAELRPAKELGIRTVLLDHTGKSSRRWADAVVTKLSEIPQVVNEILQTP
jgi:putative hydrolase of the HAD superfamily